MSHSKLPFLKGKFGCCVNSSETAMVCECTSDGNAEFIVNACNNHGRLVEMLEKSNAMLREFHAECMRDEIPERANKVAVRIDANDDALEMKGGE